MTPTLHRNRDALLSGVDPRPRSPRVVEVVAPLGAGKTSLWEQFSARVLGGGADVAARVSAAECEGHEGLFVQALGAALARQTGVAFVPRRDGVASWLRDGLADYRKAALPERTLVIGVDDLEALSEALALTRQLAALVTDLPPGIAVVLLGRSLPTVCRRDGAKRILRAELAWTAADIEQVAREAGVTDPDALAQLLLQRTSGWPALVGPALNACVPIPRQGWAKAIDGVIGIGDGLARRVGREVLASLRPETQYVARVAAVVPEFDDAFMQRLLRADVSGTVEERRRLIRLPPEAVASHLDTLVDHQVLDVTRDGNYRLPTALRAGFLADLESGAAQETHRRAAELVLEHDGAGPSAVAVDLLVDAQQLARVHAILETHAERFFLDGAERPGSEGLSGHGPLQRWLNALEGFYATAHPWVHYYLGRIATAAGDWEAAKARLDLARAGFQKHPSATPWRWQPRLAVAFAEMLWRRGAVTEAVTWCRRGADRLASDRRKAAAEGATVHEAELRRLALTLTALEARVGMEISNRQRSTAGLEAALAASTGHGRMEARVRADLVACRVENAIRGGERTVLGASLADARAMAKTLNETRYRCRVEALEAQAALRFDAVDGAWEAAERAVALARGDVSVERVVALTTRAAVALARGDLDGALAGTATALDTARAVGVPVCLVADALLLRATAGVFAERSDIAAAALVEVEDLVGVVLRLDGYLTARHAEVSGLQRALVEPSLANAVRYLAAALDGYGRYGSQYDEARVHWRLAHLHHAAVLKGEASAAEGVFEHLACAARLISALEVPLHPIDDPTTLLLVGLHGGDEALQAFCDQRLASLSVSDVVRGEAQVALAGHYPAARGGLRLPVSDWIVITRLGIEALGDAECERLRASPPKKGVLVWAVEHEVDNFGQRISLRQKRVMMPLLMRLLDSPDAALSMRELAADVWGASSLTATIQTKIKVAVSRLRTLLGKERDYIVTRRKDEAGTSVVAYQIAPDLAYQVIRRGDDGS